MYEVCNFLRAWDCHLRLDPVLALVRVVLGRAVHWRMAARRLARSVTLLTEPSAWRCRLGYTVRNMSSASGDGGRCADVVHVPVFLAHGGLSALKY